MNLFEIAGMSMNASGPSKQRFFEFMKSYNRGISSDRVSLSHPSCRIKEGMPYRNCKHTTSFWWHDDNLKNASEGEVRVSEWTVSTGTFDRIIGLFDDNGTPPVERISYMSTMAAIYQIKALIENGWSLKHYIDDDPKLQELNDIINELLGL